MKLSRIQIVLIGIVLLAILVVGLVFTCVVPGLRSCDGDAVGYTGELTVWGVFDSKRIMEETLISDFIIRNPGVIVRYRQFDPRTYETELINALAAGTGPDVFMVHNTWLPKHKDKLFGLTSEQFPLSEIENSFPAVVKNDLTDGANVYALPLYIDSLALFYNRDIFDASGIAQPPTTWSDVERIVPQLRRLDSVGRIQRAAAAIGGSMKNIDRAPDLLSLLMLQQGVQMVNSSRSAATFASDGQTPLNFYVSFARPTSANYTWDPTFSQSVDAFSEGKTAMIFHYGYEIPLLKAKNPFLNFAIAPMPQQALASSPVNYASYWGLAVSRKTADPAKAWAFIFNSTMNPDTSERYLQAAGRSPALRSLIDTYISRGGEMAVFARQALTAASWWQADPARIDTALSNMIDAVVAGQLTADRALSQAQVQVTELMPQRQQ